MTSPTPPGDGSFVEVADRCWVARHSFLDVNVSVVAGERGLLVVDTHASEAAFGRALDRLREIPGLGTAPVVAVVNTHDHWDHVLGNAVLAGDPDVESWSHEEAAALMADGISRVQEECAAHPEDPPAREVVASRLRLPRRTFSSAAAVDLGDRVVELLHPGRGHTAGDAVVVVPDADVILSGDLVEESGPPGMGPDSYLLEWPATLDLLLGMTGPDTVVVPGHGAPVGMGFVLQQRGDLGMVAEQVRHLAGQGVPADDVLAEGEWPYPAEALRDVVVRAYQQLPREGRSLPLA